MTGHVRKAETTVRPRMEPLDTLTFPLSQASLIEASAGTGKTYTIVNLYIRLLLGHGCTPLGVEQILVVTFTNAATGELKERIRQRLRQTYLDFFAKSSQDHFIQKLIEQSDNLDLDCQRLALASKQMDEAAVYTIHGFCHKALTEHAFESGAMYEQNFILDQSEWLKLAAEDYWRKHVVTLAPSTLQLLLTHWSSPDAMVKKMGQLFSQHAQFSHNVDVAYAVASVEQYVQQVSKVKKWWLTQNVGQQLSQAKLSGRAKLAKLPTLHAMQVFCKSDLLVIDFDKSGWQLFAPEQITKAAKKGSLDLSHLDFSQFELLHQQLTACQQQLVAAFSQHAMTEVLENLASHKRMLQLLSPDDLLAGLQSALQQQATAQSGSHSLADTIRKNFPAALIDEFQDTDPIQFEVFRGIYGTATQSASCWIMIGDPKQAIYAFRGADIFTYMEAKDWVNHQRHFTLSTNWRSAPALISGINQLFSRSQKGFLYEDSIPFYPVAAGRDFSGLTIQGQAVECLDFQHFCSIDNLPIAAKQAMSHLATATANQIAQWLQLASHHQALIDQRAITAGDCCVLVRDRNEAQVMKNALSAVGVASVFLTRKSVFSTEMAADLLRLLKALNHPTDERLLKTALLSGMFSFSAQQLDQLFNDELIWQQLLEHCFIWHQTWQKHGLMRTINLVLKYFDVEQGLLKHRIDGFRQITDLRHLIELLQQKSLLLVGETQLIHWFENCLLEPDHNSESQQMRLENDADLVQIITLHSSKGLEFPLVFMPFASNFKNAKQALYHNDHQQLEVDLLQQEQSLKKADFERLAEDIRLFYVAVTRAVYYCSIGVWNINLNKSKKLSGFTQSALGNLLMSSDAEEQNMTDEMIANQIKALAATCALSYRAYNHTDIEQPTNTLYQKDKTNIQSCNALTLNKPISRTWRLTSYSAISSQQVHLDMPTPGQDEGQDPEMANVGQDEFYNMMVEPPKLSPFTFERGANAGSFLHGVLENIDFQKPQQLSEVIAQQSTRFNIDESWHAIIETWLTDVLLTPISTVEQSTQQNTMLNLARLSASQIKVEMEFHMPLHQVNVRDFNQIINQYYRQHSRDYQFEQLNGMIKGFIDLMFEFDGKFYVADYKSNHLGDAYQDYHHGAMERAMTEHDYHLQGILYILALHRWLKHNLADYAYETHMGGGYYLFIRGMSQSESGHGVYFMLPNQAMIHALDDLFSGQKNALNKTTEQRKQVESEQSGQLDLW